MKTDDERLDDLRVICPDVQRLEEGGQVFAFFPALMIRTAAGIVQRRALLNPRLDGGYTTRLYLDAQIPAVNARNWQATTKAGASWWVCSWNQVPADLPWYEIVVNHLRAYA